MPSFIGVVDAQITSKQTVNHQMNKIGGVPDLPDKGARLPPLQCSLCSQPLVLVVQLYCPLEGSSYHRTLYVFACTTPACWNKQDSWMAIRCQVLDPQFSQNQAAPELSTTTTAADDDDWVTAGGADDWGVDCDDWGEAGDSDNKVDAEDMVEADTQDSLQEKLNDGQAFGAGNNTDESTDPSVDLHLQQMCLDEVADDEDDAQYPGSHIVAEDLPTAGLNDLKTLVAQSSQHGDGERVLVSYYVDVFEEPERVEPGNDDQHVTELLRQYQRQEGGLNIEEDYNGGKGSKGAKGGGGGGEKYEKTSVVHADTVFYRFMKRLAVCPEQCVRYEWGGSPLFIRQPQRSRGDSPVSCQHCGGATVYEAQLMPALVNSLKFPIQQGAALEFGTVILFTCQRSCWSDSDTYRTERLVVQADPDQEKFKV